MKLLIKVILSGYLLTTVLQFSYARVIPAWSNFPAGVVAGIIIVFPGGNLFLSMGLLGILIARRFLTFEIVGQPVLLLNIVEGLLLGAGGWLGLKGIWNWMNKPAATPATPAAPAASATPAAAPIPATPAVATPVTRGTTLAKALKTGFWAVVDAIDNGLVKVIAWWNTL